MELARLRTAAASTGDPHPTDAAAGTVRVEQILSGQVTEPVRFSQAHDEWVLLVAGAATLHAEGATYRLTAGDWLLLPAGVPHELRSVTPGTSWVAVHAPAPY